MTSTDKKCYEIATEIIEDIFWKKYESTILESKPWYDNLNDFLVKEWILLKKLNYDDNIDNIDNIDNTNDRLPHVQEVSVIGDAIQILINKLNIDNTEFEYHENELYWEKFDYIIEHYIYQLKSLKQEIYCSI